MIPSQEQLDLISLWGSAGLKCHDETLLPKVHQAGTQTESSLKERQKAWDECVHVYLCEDAGEEGWTCKFHHSLLSQLCPFIQPVRQSQRLCAFGICNL